MTINPQECSSILYCQTPPGRVPSFGFLILTSRRPPSPGHSSSCHLAAAYPTDLYPIPPLVPNLSEEQTSLPILHCISAAVSYLSCLIILLHPPLDRSNPSPGLPGEFIVRQLAESSSPECDWVLDWTWPRPPHKEPQPKSFPQQTTTCYWSTDTVYNRQVDSSSPRLVTVTGNHLCGCSLFDGFCIRSVHCSLSSALPAIT